MKCSLKGNKLYFDEFFYIDLNRDTIVEFDLKNKGEITEAQYRELIYRRAKSMGYFLLARRDYTKKDLYTKLVEKYRNKEIIKEIISEFAELGYMDDVEYARAYIDSHPNFSTKKLQFMLEQKGVEKEIVTKLLEGSQDRELEEIKRQWKKLGDREYQKKIASLMRKGFGYGEIQRAIKDL